MIKAIGFIFYNVLGSVYEVCVYSGLLEAYSYSFSSVHL